MDVQHALRVSDNSGCTACTLRVGDNSGCTACTLALQFMMSCMIPLAGPHHVDSHQHVEFREARRLHELKDMNKCLDWFRLHDPSDGNVPQLPSLSSGLASSEGYGINLMKRRQMAVIYNDVLTVYMLDMQT